MDKSLENFLGNLMISARPLRSGRDLLVRWKRDKKCPDCGKVSTTGEKDSMRDVCGKMWRKYHDLDDKACYLWSNGQVASVLLGKDHTTPIWENLPPIVGRS
jgi:hypothetical protein